MTKQSLLMEGDKVYDRLDIDLVNGEKKEVFFDITIPFQGMTKLFK